MPKKIKCESCGMDLGEIEKGKIKKGTVFLCALCEGARKLSHPQKELNDFGIFKDLFKQ